MADAAASIERILAILSEKPTILSPAHPKPAPESAPDIELKDVSFSYDALPVLRDVSFTAPAGQDHRAGRRIRRGQSTIFHVLTRLEDPTGGDIRIGGTSARDMALGDLRGLFSVVSQDAALFDETIRENICLGRDVPEPELTAALEAAHVADFLPRLSDGLDTPAGPRGSNLSGGQRQRVAIARALLRNAPILLLDEATSALDAQSERIVQDALDRLSRGRTTLVIAHRLSTVKAAHQIIVMDHGRVVDIGNHDTLLARGGIYADLYRMQFQFR